MIQKQMTNSQWLLLCTTIFIAHNSQRIVLIYVIVGLCELHNIQNAYKCCLTLRWFCRRDSLVFSSVRRIYSLDQYWINTSHKKLNFPLILIVVLSSCTKFHPEPSSIRKLKQLAGETHLTPAYSSSNVGLGALGIDKWKSIIHIRLSYCLLIVKEWTFH
jgi:hypothetical protein